jgi:hypothetical protein
VQAMRNACSFNGAGCDIYYGLACNAVNNTCQTARIANPGEACGMVMAQSQACYAGVCERGQCRGSVPLGGACDLDGGAPCVDTSRCVATTDGGTVGTCQVPGRYACN